ncbi:hypothetical protein [Polaromonas sp. DSR2-3-2]|uniref:hypothetical protein n=1 Tax=unclassified Polaromonas TaxID=2638319 RepID=UPI003CE683DF
MNNKPLFTPTADGIQPAGVLILLASEIHENPGVHQNGRLQSHIDAMLTAARAGGFTQGDILATLLSKNEVSHRVKAMAVQASAAAGNEALGRIFEALRNRC